MQTEGPPCNALFCVWLCVCVCICVRYLDHRFKIIIRLRLDVRSHVDHYCLLSVSIRCQKATL